MPNVDDSQHKLTEPNGNTNKKNGKEVKPGNNATSNPMSNDPLVTAILEGLDKKLEGLNGNVNSVKSSLQFSQSDIDNLKIKNRTLRNKITQLELEEKRNELQVKSLEGRLDRLDTSTGKRNLVLEGIEETADGKDNLHPLMFQLFKQIGIPRHIDYDTCYRMGQLRKGKCRPITIIFQKQADRDEVYARRTQMKKSPDFHDIWLNEDVGQQSRRTNTLVRLVAKEAQREGIPHKPSKYSINFTPNDKKYDENNFDELPEPVSLHDLKTIRFDGFIAYQSEHSKFSNFYPSELKIGKHNYSSVEQAYHHLRARAHNQFVLALKILLKREAREIKQMGGEIKVDHADVHDREVHSVTRAGRTLIKYARLRVSRSRQILGCRSNPLIKRAAKKAITRPK